MAKPAGPVARKSDYTFETIPFAPKVKTKRAEEARVLLKREHYAGGGANTAVLMMGLVRKSDDKLVGVAQWLPPTKPAAEYAAKRCTRTSWREVLALSRLAVDADEPQNAATILIGASIRKLKSDKRWSALLTYADSGQQHQGTIYRASNWTECGTAAPRARWVDPKTGRIVGRKATVDRTVAEMERLGYERGGAFKKLRFVYALRGSCACDATR